MLSPRLTNCPECANIPSLLKKIDCRLAELGNNLYNNISYMLNKPVPANDILQLIGYRRILTHKYCNPNYVHEYSVAMIASRVIRLTLGCVSKCNEPERCLEEPCDITIVPNPTTTSTSTLPITTTTTSSSSTSTTTSTSSSTSTTTSTTTVVSTEWIIFASFNPYSACQQIDGENVTVYTSTPFLGNNVTVYLDAALTIPYVSNPSTNNVLSDGTNHYFLGDTGGAVIVFSGSCAPFVPTTTTTSSSSSTSTTTSTSSSTTTSTTTICEGCIAHDVTIGTQVWTGCNLDVTTYRNGDPIPEVTDQATWESLTTGAWCYYNNDPLNNEYGKLYNWYAVNDPRGLAPVGYHVPTDAEWTTLSTFLGGEAVAGSKLKQTGFCHWLTPNYAATDETGFTAFGGGYRYDVTGFNNLKEMGEFWSSTEYNITPETAWTRTLYYTSADIYRSFIFKIQGMSVRLIKDTEPTTTTTTSSSSTTTTTTTTAGPVSSILGTTELSPWGIVIDPSGNVYTANYNSSNVTKITPSGTSSVLGTTGANPIGIAIDSSGNIYTANSNSNNVSKITPSGVSSILGPTGIDPWGIVIDSSGNVYTSNEGSNDVTKITPAGVSTVHGTVGGTPREIAIDSAGNIYTANISSATVTKITPSGISTLFATTGPGPWAITVDSSNNIYTTDALWNVTKITPSGTSTTLGTTGSNPRGIVVDSSGNVYTANAFADNVTKITQAGVSTILETTGTTPQGITVDAVGNVYTANFNSNNVTKITL